MVIINVTRKPVLIWFLFCCSWTYSNIRFLIEKKTCPIVALVRVSNSCCSPSFFLATTTLCRFLVLLCFCQFFCHKETTVDVRSFHSTVTPLLYENHVHCIIEASFLFTTATLSHFLVLFCFRQFFFVTREPQLNSFEWLSTIPPFLLDVHRFHSMVTPALWENHV